MRCHIRIIYSFHHDLLESHHSCPSSSVLLRLRSEYLTQIPLKATFLFVINGLHWCCRSTSAKLSRFRAFASASAANGRGLTISLGSFKCAFNISGEDGAEGVVGGELEDAHDTPRGREGMDAPLAAGGIRTLMTVSSSFPGGVGICFTGVTIVSTLLREKTDEARLLSVEL